MLNEIPFCPDWSEYASKDSDARYGYVAAELRRLAKEGKPLLRPVLATLDDNLTQHALDLLHGQVDPPDRQPLFPEGPRLTATLRVVKGAVLPTVDPQGRPVERGKLVAKVGNLGGKAPPNLKPSEYERYGGEQRRVAILAGRDVYATVTLTERPTTLSLAQALSVLRQWGYGCQLRRYQKARDHELRAWAEAGADPEKMPRGQDLWLVEEVPQKALAATGT